MNVNWTAKTFDTSIAHALAQCASIAYDKDKKKASDTIKETLGMKWVQFFHLEETEALLAYHDTALILAFRGTSSIVDAWTDVKIKLIPGPKNNGRIHEGFKTGLDKVWNEIWHVMGRLRGNRTVWVTGHSLGGALALTATARLYFEKNRLVNGLYTFGQPRVGDVPFVKACNKAFGKHYYRFVHNNDIVPRVPFRAMEFEHTGIFKYINATKKLDDSLTWELITKDRLDGRIGHFLKPGTDGISDHSMINYLNALGG